jgi:hypothetical protein
LRGRQLQACFLVADDVMDASVTRRGQPCWYKLDNVGMIAINDGFLLRSSLFVFLKHYFSTTPYYVRLLEMFNEVCAAARRRLRVCVTCDTPLRTLRAPRSFCRQSWVSCWT